MDDPLWTSPGRPRGRAKRFSRWVLLSILTVWITIIWIVI